MKQLELKLKKNILIIESESGNYAYDYRVDEEGPHPIKFICKGSDLSEDIAKGLVPNDLGFLFDGDSKEYYAYPDYKNIDHPFEDKSFDTALESFISAIQSKNYHWGENPVKEPPVIMYDDFNPWAMQAHDDRVNAWKESESRTFNPSKCIIFEIV